MKRFQVWGRRGDERTIRLGFHVAGREVCEERGDIRSVSRFLDLLEWLGL